MGSFPYNSKFYLTDDCVFFILAYIFMSLNLMNTFRKESEHQGCRFASFQVFLVLIAIATEFFFLYPVFMK